MQQLTPDEARRTAVAAQGLGSRRLGARGGRVDGRHLRAVAERLHVVQIDSVNVLARSHELPFFSRLGPYPQARLKALVEVDRALFEYWAHEASIVAVAVQPSLRWRMARAAEEAWGGMRRIAAERPDLVERVYDAVAGRGPVTAAALEADPDLGRPRTGTWWTWGDAKVALEFLFWTGRVTAAARLSNFARAYDLTERVLPAAVLDAPTPTREEAMRDLVARAAEANGVAAVPELADHFRIPTVDARRAATELAEAGVLEEVAVPGWKGLAYLHRAATVPGRVSGQALLSPFDSLVWHRPRAERLFGVRIRLEVYTPAPKRVHGYYVLPFLLGDRIVARVDLKADRAAGVLRALATHLEPGHDAGRVVEPLVAELRLMAGWLGLGTVAVHDRGDLAPLARRVATGAADPAPS